MLHLIISGCNGRMGHALEDRCASALDLEIVAGFDVLGTADRSFPVCAAPAEFGGEADVVVDFSHPAALTALLDFCIRRQVPAVLATTGYSEEQLGEIEAAARSVPLFRSANLSLGVNVLTALVQQCAALLGEDFDVEIVERHHNKKVDAPSGTALLLADAAASALPYAPAYVYDRHSVRTPRDRREIGISSVRGGTIAGDHEVVFAGRDEVLELRHTAQTREVFASGALKAARFLATRKAPRLYGMGDLMAWLRETAP